MQSLEGDVTQIYADISDILTNYGLDILGAVAILLFGLWAAGRVSSAVARMLAKVPQLDDTLETFLSTLARYIVIAVTIVAVLAQFGVETTSIIAVLGAAGLAIGLALQGTLQNIAAGIMLLFLRPFKVGDFVDAGGVGGTVNSIGLFVTVMTTADGVYRSVPNSALWNTDILNYSRNPTRRMDITVGIGYGDDVEKGLAVLAEMLEGDPRVLKDPAPQVMVTALADSAVNLNMRCWANAGDFWALQFDLNKWTKERLEGAGLSIPYPQQDVHLHQVATAT
jgi:small conductance mechanosensitive channel